MKNSRKTSAHSGKVSLLHCTVSFPSICRSMQDLYIYIYIIGSYHKVRILLMGWIIFTVVYLIWTQVLVSIMATKEVTADFLCGITIAQLANFTICSYFLGIVVTFYFEMKKVIVIEKNPRKMNHNRFQ